MADPLSDVLGSVRLNGAVWFVVECGGTWATAAPPASAVAARIMPGAGHVIEFHAVTRGRCVGGLVGEPPVPLEAGDVICFPHGDAHVLGSAAGLRTGPPDLAPFERALGGERPARVRYGDAPGVDASIVCGFLGCDARPFNPLLSTLPRLLRASDREGPRGGWLSRFVEAAAAEADAPRPGSDGVLARLSELMFVEVVRRHLAALPAGRTGWLAGLRDPNVGRALAALHARPGHPWSLDALAREAGLSRSVLAERFAALVGEPPMQYLARWRMQVAAGLLASTHDGMAAIAAAVGYASEAAFNRAFRKLVGVPPATWRRGRRGPDVTSGAVPTPSPDA
ncbi:MAG: AraC family transcriptional regulator [Anaeromyxobacter sp.]